MTDYPWAEDDETLKASVIAGGNTLADAMGWHATKADYAMARIVIRGGRQELEAPLRAQVEALTSSLRAANGTTRIAQKRAADAEAEIMVVRDKSLNELEAWAEIAASRVRELQGLLLEIARSAVEHGVPHYRSGYVTVQIDRETWDAIRRVAGPTDADLIAKKASKGVDK